MILPRSSVNFNPIAYQNIAIDPAAYGKGGSGLIGMAKALESVGNTADTIWQSKKEAERPERDEIIAALNAIEANTRRDATGADHDQTTSTEAAPKGYLKTTGEEALAAHGVVVKKMAKDHAESRKNLSSDEQRERFDRVAETIQGPVRKVIDAHHEQQKKVVSKNIADRASQEARKTIVAFKDAPELTKLAWEIGPVEACRAAALDPDGGISPQDAGAKWTSTTHYGLIKAELAQGNIQQAKKRLIDNKKHLKGDDLTVATAEVKQAEDQAVADAAVAPLKQSLVSHNRVGQGNTSTKIDREVTKPPVKKADATGESAVPAVEASADQQAPVAKTPRPMIDLPAYPYTKDSSHGLPTLEELHKEFERTADHSELSETQRDYGWASLQRDHALAKKAARQQRQDDLATATQMIGKGAIFATLPLDLQNRLDENSRLGLKRVFLRVHGLARNESDWAAFDSIASDSNDDFAQRLLVQDQPYLSTPLYAVIGKAQSLLRSDDLVQRNQGMSYMRAIRLSAEAMRLLPQEQRTSERMDVIVADAFRMVGEATQSGKPWSKADLQKRLTPYLIEARLEHAQAQAKAQADAKVKAEVEAKVKAQAEAKAQAQAQAQEKTKDK
jgi:hypothetical protein